MQATKLQTNYLTAPIGMGTGPLFLSLAVHRWHAPDRTAHVSYGFSSYGPHSCLLRYAGIDSVVL